MFKQITIRYYILPVIFFRAENIVEEMTVVAIVSAPVKGDFTTLLKTFSQVFTCSDSDVHLTLTLTAVCDCDFHLHPDII